MGIICFFTGILFFYTHHVYAIVFLTTLLFFHFNVYGLDRRSEHCMLSERWQGWSIFQHTALRTLGNRLQLTGRDFYFGWNGGQGHFYFIILSLAGSCWAFIHQQINLEQGMPAKRLISNAKIEGKIISIPLSSGRVQFQIHIDRLNNKPVSSVALISCYYHCPTVNAGEYWQLSVKLRRPQNLMNPGGFDYKGMLSAKHINWVGYLNLKQGISKPLQKPVSQFSLLKCRQFIANRLATLDSDVKTLGIWQALTLGITHHINNDEWNLFRRTGTVHLMVISGAHIGLIAGLTYKLLEWLWCRSSRLCLLMPAPKVASLFGLLCALMYTLLAGFGVPAQRALIVCFFMLLRYLCHRRFSSWQAWRYALLGVILFEPHSVLMSGFYLSFLAVATLLLMGKRIISQGWKKTILLQFFCLLSLTPLSLYWFSYGSLNGMLANLMAIPWVSFVIVPLSLLTLIGAFLPLLNIKYLLVVLKTSIGTLFYFLNKVDLLANFNLEHTFFQIAAPISIMLGFCIFCFIPDKRLFFPTCLLILSSFFPPREKIHWGGLSVDVMDVGQGLAILIRTAGHVLLYDTGAKFYHGSDMGQLAIIPYLKTLGINKLDKLVLSHPDLDHRGGFYSIQKKYSIDELIVDNPAFYHKGLSCHQYPSWDWDGVTFQFFPLPSSLEGKNNNSCVLQVKNGRGQVLLTGDIEKNAETYLVKTYKKALQSSYLVVPHHGSKTSSSLSFIKQVNPQYAIISAALDNKYHFPHAVVMANFKKQGIKTLNTADCGMVTIDLNKRTKNSTTCFRDTAK